MTRLAGRGTDAVRGFAAVPEDADRPHHERPDDDRPDDDRPGEADERVEARQALEALRLGVVPASFVGDTTVARDGEVRALVRLLTEGGLRVVWGGYGAGKTHLLDLFALRARARGMATATVALDPREVPPSHPRRFYRAAISRLRLPGSAGDGLEELFARLAGSRAHARPGGARANRFLSPALFAAQRGERALAEQLRDYARAEPVDTERLGRRLERLGWRGARLLRLTDYRTFARLYLHILGALASWCRDAGAAGLCLLCDEVEYASALDGVHRPHALQLLRHLAAATLPRRALAFDPESPAALYRGGQPVHRAIPLRFRRRQPLSVVLALTPTPRLRALLEEVVRLGRNADLELELRPLRRRDLGVLRKRIAHLYARAHPESAGRVADWTRTPSNLELITAGATRNPRELARAIVASLDDARLAERDGSASWWAKTRGIRPRADRRRAPSDD